MLLGWAFGHRASPFTDALHSFIINRMKDYFYWLAGIACIGCCSLAWSSNARPGNRLEVQIIDLPEKPLKNALLRISEKQKSLKSNFTPSTIRRFYHHIPQEIKLAIQPYGYFKPKIHAYLKQKNHFWFAYFKVTPGPRMKFTTLDLKVTGAGSTDPVFQRFHQHFPVKPGHYFNSQKYETEEIHERIIRFWSRFKCIIYRKNRAFTRANHWACPKKKLLLPPK